ncbi:MAG: PQQ-dependent sugar dehydrogenase, partial [Thermodesulfobacteriota bacterium]
MNRSVKNFISILLFILLFTLPAEAELPKGFKVSDYLTKLNQCITLAFNPDGRLFFLEKTGKVRVVSHGVLDPKPWAEIAVDPVSERGLLGIAFDPNFEKNHYVYLFHSVKRSNNNRVIRMTEREGRGVNPVTVLEIPDHIRAANHNGGNITFGPDGFLYITVGDGGGWPGRSQDDTNLLGKILRVDVRGTLPVTY